MSRIIQTKDPATGQPNGCVHLFWNALDQPEKRPDQVYACVVAPRCCKGPHLHYKRRGWFHGFLGSAEIVILRDGKYQSFLLMAGLDPVLVLPGEPACIYNGRDKEAVVLNMPSPGYDPNDLDEHTPEIWEHPDWWGK